MQAARLALLRAVLEQHRHSTTNTTSKPPADTDTAPFSTGGTDYGALPSLPAFRADLFPQEKFLSIKSRTPDAYLNVRREIRSHARALEAQIKPLMQESSSSTATSAAATTPGTTASPTASATLNAQAESALDAYTPLTAKAAEELLSMDAKAQRLEAMQGFVLTNADIYQLFHTHVQCGSFDTAVHVWLLQRLVGEARGPPYPLSVCMDVATLLRLQCLPRLPDTSLSGVLWLSRLESASSSLSAVLRVKLADSVVGRTPAGAMTDDDDEAIVLADALCRVSAPLTAPSLPCPSLDNEKTVASALFKQYTQLVDACLLTSVMRLKRQQARGAEEDADAAVVETGALEEEEEEGAPEDVLVRALRELFARTAPPMSPQAADAAPTRPLSEEPGVGTLVDLLTLHATMKASASAASTVRSSTVSFTSPAWSTSTLPAGGSAADAFTHSQRLVEAVCDGGLVQGTHPYPIHLLGTWLLPLWEACSGLDLLFADAVPLLNEAGDDEKEEHSAGDAEGAEGEQRVPTSTRQGAAAAQARESEDAAPPHDDAWRMLIPDPQTQAVVIRRVLTAFTPLHTPFSTSTPTRALSVPRDRAASSSPSASTQTIPVVTPIDTDAYGSTRASLVLGPLYAITKVFLLLTQAAVALKEMQLITALEVAFCAAFLECSAHETDTDKGEAGRHATEEINLAVGTWSQIVAASTPDSEDERIREAVVTHLTTFANDFLSITAYARQSYTTDRTLWSFYDRFTLLNAAVASSATNPDAVADADAGAVIAPLALAWMHVDAQQIAADGAVRMGSRMATALDHCLAQAARSLSSSTSLSDHGSDATLDSCAVYMASVTCDLACLPAAHPLREAEFDAHTNPSPHSPLDAPDALASRIILSSIHTRQLWRKVHLNSAPGVHSTRTHDDTHQNQASSGGESGMWPCWLDMLQSTFSHGASSNGAHAQQPQEPRPNAEDSRAQVLSGLVEFLVYDYATRLERDFAKPLRGWTATLLDLSDETAPSLTRAACQSWCAAVQTELLARVESVFSVLEKSTGASGSACVPWQPSALASLAVLLCAGLPPHVASTEPTPGTATEEVSTARGRALLQRIAQSMKQLVREPSSTTLVLSGNALSVVLLCLARAGLWDDVASVLDMTKTEKDTARPLVWCTPTTLDSVVLAEVFTRARAAGAATVCARLRQLREGIFF